MIIREASLCLRFYTPDGWTRAGVVALVKGIPLDIDPVHVVCPRWFGNNDKDKKYCRHLYEDYWQHLDCDCYAVYHPDVSFDEEKLKQHTIIPFGSIAV